VPPGLPEHPLGRPALAADTSALVGQIEVLDIERQDLVARAAVSYSSRHKARSRSATSLRRHKRCDLLARQCPGAIDGDRWLFQASRRVSHEPGTSPPKATAERRMAS